MCAARRGLAVAVVLGGVAVGLLAGTPGPGGRPGAAAAAPAPFTLEKPLTLTADEVTVDNTGATLVARGHVLLTYGADRATADLLRLNRAARTAELSGHVAAAGPEGRASGRAMTLYLTPDNQVTKVAIAGSAGVETKQYALSADQIVADRASGRLVAQGHVTAFSAPDLIVTGERIAYDQRTQYGLVTGHPVVENKAGRVRGDRIELFRAENRAVVHGPVEADVYGATITSAEATVNFRQAVAVLTGHVVIIRRQGTLQADRVTILYDRRRLIAQGATHARFTDLGEASTP